MSNYSYNRFQERNKKRIVANQDSNASFVFNAYNTTTITQQIDNEVIEKTASVVNLQEKDLAYIYTALKDPLSVGSIWGTKGLHWLIAEQIIVIKDVKWNKYLAFLCNIELENTWGYFIGPEKKFINVSLEKKAILESQQHPILVMPTGTLEIGEKIMAGGRAWLVQEKDNISTFGIDYYSLVQTTMQKVVDQETGELKPQEDGKQESPAISYPTFQEEEKVVDNIHTIAANQDIYVTTEGGYFKTSNNKIQIKTHTSTLVIFSIPFGLTDEIIITSKENNELVETIYKAV